MVTGTVGGTPGPNGYCTARQIGNGNTVMVSDRSEELLAAATTVTGDDVDEACRKLEGILQLQLRQHTHQQAGTVLSCANTIFAYVLSCLKQAGLLEGRRKKDYVSILAGALDALGDWDGINNRPCLSAWGSVELDELLFVEDFGDDYQNAPGYKEFWLVARFLP